MPAGRSGVLAYTAILWMVPLSLLVGEKVGWQRLAGAALGLAGIVVLSDPWRFDWHNHRIVMGHIWLLLAGFTWALAMLHTRRHRWRGTPLDALPWRCWGGRPHCSSRSPRSPSRTAISTSTAGSSGPP